MECNQEHCLELGPVYSAGIIDGIHHRTCRSCGHQYREDVRKQYQLKIAKRKDGKIVVLNYQNYEDALKFLTFMKTKGYNGIISKNGKPIKENKNGSNGI